jgi:hypothetical protein
MGFDEEPGKVRAAEGSSAVGALTNQATVRT